MAIAARLEEHPAQADRAPRRTLRLAARGALASGEAEVLVHNVSATGLLLECAAALAVDDPLTVGLPQAGATRARVVWASGRLFGCQFEAPLSPAALSAAQLRGAVTADLALPPAAAEGRESFGVRLRRLRHARGLTQAQVAAALGVSKPTVWAWEQGKSRPEEHRLEPLAHALGASPAELLACGDAGALDDIVARARERIAVALGTELVKVRILIEL